MFRLSEKKLALLYSKAKEMFLTCIGHQENLLLLEEINLPISSILMKEESIKIIFIKNDLEKFTIETKVQLVGPNNKVIGDYTYLENELGIAVDDVLFFE